MVLFSAATLVAVRRRMAAASFMVLLSRCEVCKVSLLLLMNDDDQTDLKVFVVSSSLI